MFKELDVVFISNNYSANMHKHCSGPTIVTLTRGKKNEDRDIGTTVGVVLSICGRRCNSSWHP